MTVKHTHLLASGGPVKELDVWATHLALSSRGKRVLKGTMCRSERDLLAAELDDGVLAELLRSERPIVVTAEVNSYRIEEV